MTTTANKNTTVATTILQQLGGGRFVTMTGAKHVFSDGDALVFQLPRNFAKDGINAVRVQLEADDTYTVTFTKIGTARTGYASKIVARHENVYADSLRQVFTSTTGLETSLGTMRV